VQARSHVAEPSWASKYFDRNPVPRAAPVRSNYERNSSVGGFRIGQQVAHAKFGQGVIVNAEGSGSDARVQVNFGREGMKWLALSVAKLSAV
jgi:PcrA/UvrD helicase-like protein